MNCVSVVCRGGVQYPDTSWYHDGETRFCSSMSKLKHIGVKTHDTDNSFPNEGETAEQQCVHKRQSSGETHRSVRCSSITPMLKLKLYIRTQAREACKKKKWLLPQLANDSCGQEKTAMSGSHQAEACTVASEGPLLDRGKRDFTRMTEPSRKCTRSLQKFMTLLPESFLCLQC